VFVKADPLREFHHLWIMDADGNKPYQLTSAKGQDLFPHFSPDGQFVTFSSNRQGGNFDIYKVHVKNRAIKKLTQFNGLDNHSCFSPDGQKIVFVSNRSGRQQIWVMDSDGSNQVLLTNDQGESLEPHWAEVQEEK
jgi:TolB protein